MQITEPKKTYPWIQVLRAVAALMVLFFHLQPHWDLVPLLSRFGEWTRWGFSGVDVFFVLSGFGVYRSGRAAQGNLRVPAFLWKRFSRIYFGYWPVFIVVTVIVRAASMKELLPADEMVGSFFLLYPNIWKNWIPTAWSLTFELMFYTWITAFVFFARNAVKAIVVAILLLVVWNDLTWDAAAYYGFPPSSPWRGVLTAAKTLAILAAALDIYNKNIENKH